MIFCTLNLLLKENKLTQTQIADATGITRPTLLALIKNKNQNIKYETIDELCKFLGIEMYDLLIYSKKKIEYIKTEVELDKQLSIDTNGDVERKIITTTFKIDDSELVFEGDFVSSPFGLEVTDPQPIIMNTVIKNEPAKQFRQDNFIQIFNKYIEVFQIKQEIAQKMNNSNLQGLIEFNFEVTSNGKINSVYESINQLNELEFQELMKKINYKNSKSKEDGEYEVALANSFKNIMRQKNKSHQE